MAHWSCMKHCGACCYLNPLEREELDSYLTPQELAQYYSLVGADGWCIHYQKDTRTCGIYEQRPRFCRVSVETFEQMFGVTEGEFNDFAIDCCCEQIASVYGEDSEEMECYLETVQEAR